MRTFATPQPITATADIDAGSIRFAAADRADTAVEVRPRDPKRSQDVRAAEHTEVAFTDGVLTVRTPRSRHSLGRPGVVEVTVELPTGSRVDVTGAWTRVCGEGRLGEARVTTSSGDVHLDTTGPLHLTATHGSITVERVDGLAEVSTSSGSLRIGTVDGPAVLRNTHGATTVDRANGDLRVRGNHGDITIGSAGGPVTATTSSGTLRVGEITRGSADLETAYGAIEVGVRKGVAAHLDVSTRAGWIHNTLTGTQDPVPAGAGVSVRARTSYGSIAVHHAHA